MNFSSWNARFILAAMGAVFAIGLIFVTTSLFNVTQPAGIPTTDGSPSR